MTLQKAGKAIINLIKIAKFMQIATIVIENFNFYYKV